MTKSLLLTTLAVFAATLVFPQEKAQKWGKVTEEDLKMTVYPQDSSTNAVILQDVGEVRVRLNGSVLFSHSRRIKILDASALDRGNLVIPYRRFKGNDEISNLDVQMFTPDGEKQKVKSDNIFTEKISKTRGLKKIFIPNLQKGCIIEYRYEMRSEDYVSLHDWQFQAELPVRWSEYTVTIPEYFDYAYLRALPRLPDVEETSSEIQAGTTYPSRVTRFGYANMPAIKSGEPFVRNVDDHRANLRFQLQRIQVPGNAPQEFLSNWKRVADALQGLESFGEQYLKSGRSDRLWKAFAPQLNPGDTPKQKAEKALRFVSSNLKWDEDHYLFCKSSLDEAFEVKKGNSAALNLALVALLRKAGCDALPMLLNTRSGGNMYPSYPFLEQFESVVAVLREENDMTMLDATNAFLPLGQVATEHYNGMGWLVDPNAPNWVDVVSPETTETWYGNLQLSAEGEMSGDFTMQATGSWATTWREALDGQKPDAWLKKEFASDYQEAQFDSVTVADLAIFDKPVVVKFKCRIPGAANAVNDFLYCQPVLDFWVKENPLKTPQRNYPVEFAYPVRLQYVLNLTPPPGYTIEELPPGAKIVLDHNGGRVTFTCLKSNNGSIQVILKANIAQTTFLPEEYGALRQFFDLIAEKTQLQLVLKKT